MPDPADCPVCGAPGGNCKGEASESVKPLALSMHTPGPIAPFITLDRVYEDVDVRNARTRVLRYGRGAPITREEAERLNAPVAPNPAAGMETKEARDA